MRACRRTGPSELDAVSGVGLCALSSCRFAGYTGKGYDEVIVEGDIDKQQFVAYYVKDNRVSRPHTILFLSQADLFLAAITRVTPLHRLL